MAPVCSPQHSRGVSLGITVSEGAIIDGFTITHGHGIIGGGVLVSGGTVIFANCKFLNNSDDHGGAVHNLGAAVTLSNGLFYGNTSTGLWGGGL
jgi:hypothetical protein